MALKPASEAAGILRHMARGIVPLLITLLLLVVSHLPGAFPSLAPVVPPLALMAVFYWAVHRPDWFGVTGAFVTGVLADLLLAAPLGISAGLYAVSHILLTQQQRFLKAQRFCKFGQVMELQLVVTAAQVLLWWIVLSRAPGLLHLLILNVLGLMLFPPVSWMLSRVHRALME